MSRQRDNAATLASEIDKLEQYAATDNYGSYWKQFRHVLALFETLRPLDREDRVHLQDRLNTVKTDVKDSKRDWKNTASRNLNVVRRQLDLLEDCFLVGSVDGVTRVAPGFWQAARAAGDSLREAHELRRKDRQRLRRRLNEYYDRADRSLSEETGQLSSPVTRYSMDTHDPP